MAFKRILASLDPDTIPQLQSIARREGWSFLATIREAIKVFLKTYKE